MTAPTIYRWDDPGAPALTTVANSFYEIMYACLIHGYQGKAAAGWTSLHDNWNSAGRASIQNSSKSGVLGMIRPAAVHLPAIMYVADGMVDADTPVGAKSGRYLIDDLNVLNADDQKYQRAFQGALPSQWVVIANDNFVLFWVVGNRGSLNGPLVLANDYYALYSTAFGVLDSCRGLGRGRQAILGNFVVLGGYHNRTGASYGHAKAQWWSNGSSTNHSTVDVAITGARAGLINAWFPGMLSDANAPGALRGDNAKVRIRVSPLDVVASGSDGASGWEIGTANMILLDVSMGYSVRALDTMNVLGKNQLSDVIDINGKQCLIAQMTGGSPVFISLAAEDWA